VIIKDLVSMQKIVDKHTDLDWYGWDVVKRKLSPASELSEDGIRIDGKWYSQKIYKLELNGWNIPDKYGKQ
jgi:hypothetical protein